MILVTKISNQELVLNCELIEMIESNPDTTITMTTGRKMIVRESVEDIVEKTIAYKKEIHRV